MANRRESLKIIGAIGATCAFPFSADELYGQHAHSPASAQTAQQGPYRPKSFTVAEFESVSQVAERIIPATDTPGAIGAGVPQYIDQVVSANPEHKRRFQAGLAFVPIVVRSPVLDEFLHRGELHALCRAYGRRGRPDPPGRCVGHQFAPGPARHLHAPDEIGNVGFGKVHLKRADRSFVGHGCLLWGLRRFG